MTSRPTSACSRRRPTRSGAAATEAARWADMTHMVRRRGALAAALAAAVLMPASCGLAEVDSKPMPFWDAGSPLPIPERRALAPMSRDSGQWESRSGDLEFRSNAHVSAGPEEPYLSDEEAVFATKSWTKQHLSARGAQARVSSVRSQLG